ncbi:hypothetical protein LTR86_000308 [Recurvomyces mirabilis]|nr:hypothetical protein LTR86_000308 [Recurvomyces mirabilis]
MARGSTPVASSLYALRQMLGLTPANGDAALIVDPIFVCIDCEAFEHAHHKITEIGVAVLDTRELDQRTAEAELWIEKIKYAHFKPIEYGLLKNKNFVKGCPEAFNFGTSTWIKLADARRVLQNIFDDPTRLLEAADFDKPFSKTGRDVIFLGHNASSDTSFLKQVGFNVAVDGGIKATMDTQKLAGGTKKKSIALQRLLSSLDVDAYNLHNAGNDAAYTLQAMLLMALKDQATPGSVAADLLKYSGKLPPAKYSPVVAPHVFAGTAVGCTVESTAENGSTATDTRTNIQRRAERQERKAIVRTVRSASEVPATTAMALQRPLTSHSSHIFFNDPGP